MNRYQRLLSNTGILAVGTFASKLLVFVLMPFYTAWLTTAEFGAAELITGIANFLIPFACVGVSTGVFRFAADREADREEVFSGSVVLLGIGLGAFSLLSLLFLTSDYLRGYWWLILLYVIFADVQAVFSQFLRAIGKQVLFAVQGILNTVVTVLFNVFFLFGLQMGVEGYVLSVILGNLLTALFLFFYARLWRVFRPEKVRRGMLSTLFRFSLPMIPTTVCWLITDISDRFMVTAICGEAVNGVYAAAYKLPTVITLVSGIFLQAWQFSAVADTKGERDQSLFYTRVFGGFAALSTLTCALMVLFCKPIASLLFSDAFYEAWRYMPTLLCSAVFAAIVSFLASVYLVRKRSSHSFVTALIGAVANLVLNFLLIPHMGAIGAAVATLVSYVLVMVVRLLDVHRMLPFRYSLWRLVISSVLLLALSAEVTLAREGREWWPAVIFALLVLVALPPLLQSLRSFLQKKEKE